MRPSDDLFQLISSLSKSEKRYFKLMASVQRGEKNYLRLFDVLEEMPEYDEDAVRAHFAGERFINQLTVTKHYLYELILKSLRAYHTDYSARAQIANLLKSSDILREKGLTEQALRMVDKAVAIAQEQQIMEPLLLALRARDMCRANQPLTHEEIDARHDTLCDVLDSFRNLLDYERLAAHMNHVQENGGARTEDDYMMLERCRWNPLIASSENAKTIRAEFLHLAVMAHYDYEHGSLETLVPIVARQIELMERNPWFIADRPKLYLYTLSNQALLFKRLNDVPAFFTALAYFRKRGEEVQRDNRLMSGRVRSNLFCSYHLSLMNFYDTTGMFGEAVTLIPDMEQGLKDHALFLKDTEVMRLISTAAHVQFGHGGFRESLDYCNRMFNMPEPGDGMQIYYHMRLFNLFVHYELGNFDLLGYLIPSVTRYFESRGILRRFERSVLAFFKRMLDIPVDEQYAVMHAFRNELLELQNDPASRSALDRFGYVEWVVSRIERRPLADVVRERSTTDDMRLQAA